MTVDEKNSLVVPLAGGFLMNRLIWVSLSLLILIGMYFRFSFSIRKEKSKKTEDEPETEIVLSQNEIKIQTDSGNGYSLKSIYRLILFETKAIIKNPTFLIILLLGILNLIASLTSFTGRYGSDQYPVTYDVIDSIRNSFYIFIIAIITFYSGVLVWKERDAKINEIQDATPVKSGLLFSSKLIAMFAVVEIILLSTMVVGIIAQTFYQYSTYEIGVYIKSLLLHDFLGFSYLIVLALLCHYLINNRYIAYFAFVAIVIVNSFIWSVLEVNTNMLKFAGTPDVIYSDMNGFGPFVLSLTWFHVYWTIFCTVLGFLVFAFYIRGKEENFKFRWKMALASLKKNKIILTFFLIVFLACGRFVFYNTQVLNKYNSSDEEERRQVDYEKKYKKFEKIAQPRFYKIDYSIDIMPEERCLIARTSAWIRNGSVKKIEKLFFTMPTLSDSLVISIPGGTLNLRDEKSGFRIYKLEKPMKQGDSLLIRFDNFQFTKGFENDVSFTQLTQNGTFFNNTDIVPSIGYNKRGELEDKNKRQKYKLPKRKRMPALDERNFTSRANNYVIYDADWVEVNTTISTSNDQIAVAPGSLVKSWEENGRKYFNYRLDKSSLNFYSFISANYQVARKKWNGIDLEVYYILQHAYNVPNMMKSLEKSLSYYLQNFGQYSHKQCRIIEFPRYQSFAQAFPGTMPYGEGIGFIVDLREVTKDDIDEVYYIVAHEMGHQYWAHQVCGADMQGSEMMSEGFAQYSALMVMEKEYGRNKMKKFLKYEMDGYLRGRSREFEAERPLMKTESQGYIHYQKASVVLYYLKEMIGERKVNSALRCLLDSFAYKKPPYPTSLSPIRAFKRVTPDSLQYLISDLFENITVFSNRMVTAEYKMKDSLYEVTLNCSSEKFRADSLGKEKAIPLSDYIDIGLFAKSDGDKNLGKPILYQRMKIKRKNNTFKFLVKEKPYQAGIDPYNYLVDRIPDDNVKRVGE